jgi:hypothetical protein
MIFRNSNHNPASNARPRRLGRLRFGRSAAVIAIPVLALLVVQCGDRGKVDPPRPPAPTPEVFRVGDVDKEGHLVFWQIDATDHVEPFILKDEYGVVLANNSGEQSPLPRYILAQQSTKKITDTTDFSVFLSALATIPRGSTVGRYDTCSLPRAWGLPDRVCKQFEQALKNRGLAVETENRGVCYCPYNN